MISHSRIAITMQMRDTNAQKDGDQKGDSHYRAASKKRPRDERTQLYHTYLYYTCAVLERERGDAGPMRCLQIISTKRRHLGGRNMNAAEKHNKLNGNRADTTCHGSIQTAIVHRLINFNSCKRCKLLIQMACIAM